MTAQDLTNRIYSEFPESKPRLTEFPSGAFMLDIDIGNTAWVAESVPGKGYGLSKLSNATYGWEGVDVSFPTIIALTDHILDLLNLAR